MLIDKEGRKWESVQEEDNKEKEKIPPLCEVLRVQPYQEFIKMRRKTPGFRHGDISHTL